MLKFIGFMAVFFLLIMGLVMFFQSKPPKYEVYIIQDYKIKDVLEQDEASNQAWKDNREKSQ